MAKNSKGAGDGSDCPIESVELDGGIISAAKSTFAGGNEGNFERGFPEPAMRGWERLHMENLGGRGRK